MFNNIFPATAAADIASTTTALISNQGVLGITILVCAVILFAYMLDVLVGTLEKRRGFGGSGEN